MKVFRRAEKRRRCFMYLRGRRRARRYNFLGARCVAYPCPGFVWKLSRRDVGPSSKVLVVFRPSLEAFVNSGKAITSNTSLSSLFMSPPSPWSKWSRCNTVVVSTRHGNTLVDSTNDHRVYLGVERTTQHRCLGGGP